MFEACAEAAVPQALPNTVPGTAGIPPPRPLRRADGEGSRDARGDLAERRAWALAMVAVVVEKVALELLQGVDV